MLSAFLVSKQLAQRQPTLLRLLSQKHGTPIERTKIAAQREAPARPPLPGVVYTVFSALACPRVARVVRPACDSPPNLAFARHRASEGYRTGDDAWISDASRPIALPRRPGDVLHIAAYREIGPAPCRPDAATLLLAPSSDALRVRCVVAAQGLPVSLRGFLQYLHVESLLGHQLLQPPILFFQGPQLLDHVGGHPAVLLTPAVVGLIGNAERLTDLGHLLALTQGTSA